MMLIVILLAPTFLMAQKLVSFEFLPGGAIALPSKLLIVQDDYPDLEINAKYQTKSFQLPIYYSWRLSFPFNTKSQIGIELNHLKIYLEDKPPEITRFTITHGYNQLWLNYTNQLPNNVALIYGLGTVIAHPENTIRGLQLNEKQGIANKGYYFSGITSQIALHKRYSIGDYFFISLEGKLNAAYGKVAVVNGYATVPVYTIHGLLGLGLQY